MNKFIENVLLNSVVKLSNNKYISAIKEGVISVISITIVGSFFLLIAYPPVPSSWFETVGLFKWIALNRDIILMPFQTTMSIISIFVIKLSFKNFHYLQNLCLPIIIVIGLDQIHLFVAVEGLK